MRLKIWCDGLKNFANFFELNKALDFKIESALWVP